MAIQHVKLVAEGAVIVSTGISRLYDDLAELQQTLLGKDDFIAVAILAGRGFRMVSVDGHPIQRPSNAPSEGLVVRRAGARTEQVWVTEIWMIRERQYQ